MASIIEKDDKRHPDNHPKVEIVEPLKVPKRGRKKNVENTEPENDEAGENESTETENT